jgi:hypothetical protein
MRLRGIVLSTSVQADRQGPSMMTRSPDCRIRANTNPDKGSKSFHAIGLSSLLNNPFHRSVSQHVASCQVLHFHGKLRAAPFDTVHLGILEVAPSGAQTFDLGKELIALISTQGDECRTGGVVAISLKSEAEGDPACNPR